jgi:hypothetical protein
MAFSDDLDLLEKEIKRLQIEWEKFFGGVERRPPIELRQKVERIIRSYLTMEIRNNGERFRYQTITARYNTFNELWSKRLRAMEEGRPVGQHGWRAQVAAPAATAAAAPAKAAAPVRPQEFRVRDPAADQGALRALFDRYLEARKEAGETGNVKFESFQKVVGQQASRILSEKGARAVDFRLETKDGKVSLKAKPVRQESP